MRHRSAVLAVVAASVLAVSACVPGPTEPTPTPTASRTATPTATATPTRTPTPTPTPTPDAGGSVPDPASLVLSAEGLGPLRIGMAASDSTLIAAETTDCGVVGGPQVTSWRSTLPLTWNNALATESDVFRVGVDADGIVFGVSARDASITTDLGVGIGDTLDEVLAIPGVIEGPTGGVWRRFIVPGTPGTLVFDVGDHADPEYWKEWQGRVTYVMVLSADRSVPAPSMHGPFPGGCL